MFATALHLKTHDFSSFAQLVLQSVDGADNARLGFKFMQEAQKNPEMMQDVMKDMQDPETMAKVQEMMQVSVLARYLSQCKNQSVAKKEHALRACWRPHRRARELVLMGRIRTSGLRWSV